MRSFQNILENLWKVSKVFLEGILKSELVVVSCACAMTTYVSMLDSVPVGLVVGCTGVKTWL